MLGELHITTETIFISDNLRELNVKYDDVSVVDIFFNVDNDYKHINKILDYLGSRFDTFFKDFIIDNDALNIIKCEGKNYILCIKKTDNEKESMNSLEELVFNIENIENRRFNRKTKYLMVEYPEVDDDFISYTSETVSYDVENVFVKLNEIFQMVVNISNVVCSMRSL